jgi:hypothetical protein
MAVNAYVSAYYATRAERACASAMQNAANKADEFSVTRRKDVSTTPNSSRPDTLNQNSNKYNSNKYNSNKYNSNKYNSNSPQKSKNNADKQIVLRSPDNDRRVSVSSKRDALIVDKPDVVNANQYDVYDTSPEARRIVQKLNFIDYVLNVLN